MNEASTEPGPGRQADEGADHARADQRAPVAQRAENAREVERIAAEVEPVGLENSLLEQQQRLADAEQAQHQRHEVEPVLHAQMPKV